ncbi:CBS domain-containing protein [Methanobacterium aggregans]|uniref:CBS domain-containing protein n=1 Tax=Methanobacterium aggregans TaxID=1615586 RepID=UPI001AE3B2D2|nr:CBS domain-containing protein [Methanobacterium aggregans]MBP2046370.1 CBS domain-containing protein [Methanobacterium aggregans]
MSKVEDVMTSDPVTVSIEAYATQVRSIFKEGWFRSVPVVSGNHLEGMITRGGMMNVSSTKSNLEARGIMEQPRVVATPEMDITELSHNLIKSNTLQAPVVESTGSMELVGIITVGDLIKKFLYNGEDPKGTIQDVIQRKVVTCNYDDPISAVWNKMLETGFSGLPVMKKGKIIGIMTRKDIIDSGHFMWSKSGETRSIRVERVMKTPPIVATLDTGIKEAAELIVEHDIGRIPIVENPVYIKKEPKRAKEADLVGIVSREDILCSYLN